MLPKQNRLKKNKQFTYIYKNGQTKHANKLSLSYIKTKFQPFKVGFTVSKKIGKANVRNLYKRRIKDILMKNNINFSKDYVIILRVSILNLNYEQIQNELINVLKEK